MSREQCSTACRHRQVRDFAVTSLSVAFAGNPDEIGTTFGLQFHAPERVLKNLFDWFASRVFFLA